MLSMRAPKRESGRGGARGGAASLLRLGLLGDAFLVLLEALG